MILRTEYLEKLTQWKDKDIIKVITGVRRCGKSTLMSQWKQKLQDNNIDTNHIIHINLEMLENESLLEYHALHEKIISQCKDDNMYYVLLDEIQSVENFQKAIDSLNVRENIDLYITGSNAYLLSGTLATLLSGRYIEIKMLPFSFAEFIDARKSNKITTQRLWSDYIHDGSFPAITQLKNDPNLTYDYLEGILNTILIKDVTQRTGGNAALARNISSYIYDNIGNIISPSSIAKSMSNAGHSITAPTVANYLNSLEAAYLVYSANRYDIRGKKILKQEKKYYAVDIGLRRIFCSNDVRDTGRILENIVYLELLRREKNVYVGQGQHGEIDFISNGKNGTKYWQVCETTKESKTLQRELLSFKNIKDNYPKILLTLDDEREQSFDGIRKIYVLDWLRGKVQA